MMKENQALVEEVFYFCLSAKTIRAVFLLFKHQCRNKKKTHQINRFRSIFLSLIWLKFAYRFDNKIARKKYTFV